MIYSLYIFNRNCNIIHFSDYVPPASANQQTLSFGEQTKLIYGVVFSLDTLLQKLFQSTSDGFESYSTNLYTVHYFNSPTRIRIIVFTPPEGMRDVLQGVYGLYSDFIGKGTKAVQGENGCGDLFREKVDQYTTSAGTSTLLKKANIQAS